MLDDITEALANHIEYLWASDTLPMSRSAILEDLDLVKRETVDSALTFDSDIIRYWRDLGHPDPDDLGACDSIMEAMVTAVAEHFLADDSDVYDTLDQWTEDKITELFDSWDDLTWRDDETPEDRDEYRGLDDEDRYDALYGLRTVLVG